MKIVFIDGTAGFSPQRLSEKASGGIITSLTLIPRYLAKNGVRVVVASEHPKLEEVDGVTYTPMIREEDKAADVVVFNRNIFNREMERMFPKSRKIWWLHDIVDYRYLEDDSYMKMDKIVALSEYCRDSYMDFFGIPGDKFALIPNGVDKAVFFPGKEHDRHLFVCASAPIKGLYPLLFTWHNIRRNDPEAELRVYSSQGLHDMKDSSQITTQMNQLREVGVKVLDPIPQKELADVLRKARALLMPNHYPEICSNLILQAQACGCPVVTTSIGSAPEFITHLVSGMLTRLPPHDMFWWWKDFAEKTVEIQTDDARWKRIHENAGEWVHSWDEIGKLWLDLVKN